jgi:hypothetical protein
MLKTDQWTGAIVEVEVRVNEGDTSHPTINWDCISPSERILMMNVDPATEEHFSIVKFGISFKHRGSLSSTIIHGCRYSWNI